MISIRPQGLQTSSLAIYRSPDNAENCYSLACLYADNYGEGQAWCSVDYLNAELTHYTSGEWEGSINATEIELLALTTYLLAEGVEYVLVVSQ